MEESRVQSNVELTRTSRPANANEVTGFLTAFRGLDFATAAIQVLQHICKGSLQRMAELLAVLA